MPPETGWGGIGTYVSTISRALAALGTEVHVLSVVPGLPPSRAQTGDVTVHRYPLPDVGKVARRAPEAWRRLWVPANVAWRAWGLPIRPDVVECPEWMAEGLGIAVGRRLPLVVHLHSSARQLFPFSGQGRRIRGFDRRAAFWLEEAAVRRANAVISTPWNLEELGPRLNLAREMLHPLWYPLEPPERLPMPDPGRPRVTFLGRFEPRKGPNILLGAVPAVLREVPEAVFAFVGRDPPGARGVASSDWLRTEAERLGVAHAVRVREAFGADAVETELRQSTVCAFPSRWESFGYTIAEAQGAARPVVVSSIPALRALVEPGTTGAIAASDEPGAWAAPLIELLKDPARARQMGEAGAERIARLTDPRRVAEETLVVYERAQERWRHGLRAGQRGQPA
jgi:glycogen synthase